MREILKGVIFADPYEGGTLLECVLGTIGSHRGREK